MCYFRTHHQLTRVILCNKTTQVEAILQLMVESGAIFGVVQVCGFVKCQEILKVITYDMKR